MDGCPGRGSTTHDSWDAQVLQNDATARVTWLAWVVSNTDLEFPGQLTARAHTSDHHGGHYLLGALVADTLDELHAMLPVGLTRHGRTSLDPPDVVEVWD